MKRNNSLSLSKVDVAFVVDLKVNFVLRKKIKDTFSTKKKRKCKHGHCIPVSKPARCDSKSNGAI